MPTPAGVYRFGQFELRQKTRELYKRGIRLKLRPQSYHVLQTLVERAGDVVTREELRQELWSGETFVDFEQGLNTAIKELRQALNDSATDPRFVETLPKLGYRMLAAVDSTPTRPSAEDAAATRRQRAAIVAGLVLAAVLIVAVGAYVEWSHTRVRPAMAATSGRAMLAVLPFANLTGDAGEEYFSDGLTEEVITQLGSIDPQRLGVIARTSVMHYKGSPDDVARIGRELSVQYVLEGSVRRDSKSVRITAQLIQVRDQTHLWAREYDRELSALLDLQTEIAQEIGDEIQIAIGGPAARSNTGRRADLSHNPTSYEAYDLYLKGRYFWNKRTPAGFTEAADYFRQAIAKDPGYARAYAGLADTYALMSSWFIVPQSEFVPKAREAALRALQIDDSLAEAHASLAVIAQNHDYDWQTAAKEYQRAIQLDPGYATAHQWYAEFLSLQGRFDEALAESERARQQDPLSIIIATDHGAILYFARQYDRAIQQLQAVLEMEPTFSRARVLLACAYVQEHKFADSLAEVQSWRGVDKGSYVWAVEAYVYGRSGEPTQALHSLNKFDEAVRHERLDPTPWILLTYTGMDQKDDAIALLKKAYSEHSNAVIGLKVEPNYDPWRGDPRFQDLLHQLALDR